MSGHDADWLLHQLPHGMQSEDFFTRFVRIFQAEADTLVAHADDLPYLADVRLTPPEMVRWMASWLGWPGIDAAYPEDAQRRILLTAARTLQWRGTRRGLVGLLRLYCGPDASVAESGGVFGPGEAPDGEAWVAVQVASTGPLDEADLVRLVLDEVPAHVHVAVAVGNRQVWPPVRSDEREELAS